MLIAPFIDMPMLYIKYLTMHSMQTHSDTIEVLFMVCASVQAIIHSLASGLSPVHIHKPYNNIRAIIHSLVSRSKEAKIKTRYNQVPHLTQDTTLEGDKYTIKHNLQESQEAKHTITYAFCCCISRYYLLVIGLDDILLCVPFTLEIILLKGGIIVSIIFLCLCLHLVVYSSLSHIL